MYLMHRHQRHKFIRRQLQEHSFVGFWHTAAIAIILLWLAWPSRQADAAAPVFLSVTPDRSVQLPRDYGAHPGYRTEWWYATGWLTTPDGKPLGFQITFFRSATDNDRANPSKFAPQQLIIAHVALSDPSTGRLEHDQKTARAGFDIASAAVGDTELKLDNWTFSRLKNGTYRADIGARDFTLKLDLTPTQPPMLQGDRGYSQKGPLSAQASYYYSLPQLKVSGNILRKNKPAVVTGTAWLDHEWSTSVLAADSVGWEWLGANLDDGSALMAFRIRSVSGDTVWAHAALRDASGKITQFPPDQVQFKPQRLWRSPRTNALYPVASDLYAGPMMWQLRPLYDDQELDANASTGAVYWEGAVTVMRDGRRVGSGYLELTGYSKPLKL